MSNRRAKRITEIIRKEISEIILHDLQDPRLSFITVTGVELSDDLKNAKVFVSILGDESTQRTNMRGLKSARSFIQSEIARSANVRFTPVLSFHIDESFKKMAHINELLSSVKNESAESDEAVVKESINN